jgi:hypothetical protein
VPVGVKDSCLPCDRKSPVIFFEKKHVSIISGLIYSETPAQQVTADLGCAGFVPVMIKRWSRYVATPQHFIDKMDAVNFAVASVSAKLVAQPD